MSMDAMNDEFDAPDFDLEREVETWDWARAAGVSADELRRALLANAPTPKLRKAA